MDDIRSKFGFWVFILILVIFIVGGYITMNYMINKETKDETKTDVIVEINEKRIDPTKGYIYLEETDTVIKEYSIGYPTLVINMESGKEIAETINAEVKTYEGSVKSMDEATIPEGAEYFGNEENIYSLTYKEFEVIEFGNYVTLITKDFNYDVLKFMTALKTDSYTFNKNSGELVVEEELLNSYGKTLDDIKNEIKNNLNALNIGINTINVDETINNFNYGIYINKVGQLEVTYLVKSTNQDYYDKLVIN